MDTVSRIVASSSMKITAGEGGVFVTGNGFSIEDLSEEINVL